MDEQLRGIDGEEVVRTSTFFYITMMNGRKIPKVSNIQFPTREKANKWINNHAFKNRLNPFHLKVREETMLYFKEESNDNSSTL